MPQTSIFQFAQRRDPGPEAAEARVLGAAELAALVPAGWAHRIDAAACGTIAYPSNYAEREYQSAIIGKALWQNTLVCLPTGLGKTFIAAVVMYNYHRWFPDSKIVFMAPTRPLVAQQIEACQTIVGMDLAAIAELNGEKDPPAKRRRAWESKRVFFCTPQVMANDVGRHALLDGRGVCLVVMDEAHRATGRYAYCEIVAALQRARADFRVLALTATPASNKEGIQRVVSNLLISRIEIRTEQSPDILPYTHAKHTERVVVAPSATMRAVNAGFEAGVVRPVLDGLVRARATYGKPVDQYSRGELLVARETWRKAQRGRPANPQQHGYVEAQFAMAMSLFYAHELLNRHGLVPFLNYLERVLCPSPSKTAAFVEDDCVGNDAVPPKGLLAYLRKQCGPFLRDVERLRVLGYEDPGLLRHPKTERIVEILRAHFRDAGPGETTTRAMVFANYRDSVTQLVAALREHEPIVRPMAFVGQGKGKGASSDTHSLNQREQLALLREFAANNCNTLVCTSIGEEGLDIGEVDLIVCYDTQASPVRMLQRMGRTGRRRAGRVVLLLTEGKEEALQARNEAQYKSVQRLIKNGDKNFLYFDAAALPFAGRMLPAECRPVLRFVAFETEGKSYREAVAREKEEKAERKESRQKKGKRAKTLFGTADDDGDDGKEESAKKAAAAAQRRRRLLDDLHMSGDSDDDSDLIDLGLRLHRPTGVRLEAEAEAGPPSRGGAPSHGIKRPRLVADNARDPIEIVDDDVVVQQEPAQSSDNFGFDDDIGFADLVAVENDEVPSKNKDELQPQRKAASDNDDDLDDEFDDVFERELANLPLDALCDPAAKPSASKGAVGATPRTVRFSTPTQQEPKEDAVPTSSAIFVSSQPGKRALGALSFDTSPARMLPTPSLPKVSPQRSGGSVLLSARDATMATIPKPSPQRSGGSVLLSAREAIPSPPKVSPQTSNGSIPLSTREAVPPLTVPPPPKVSQQTSGGSILLSLQSSSPAASRAHVPPRRVRAKPRKRAAATSTTAKRGGCCFVDGEAVEGIDEDIDDDDSGEEDEYGSAATGSSDSEVPSSQDSSASLRQFVLPTQALARREKARASDLHSHRRRRLLLTQEEDECSEPRVGGGGGKFRMNFGARQPDDPRAMQGAGAGERVRVAHPLDDPLSQRMCRALSDSEDEYEPDSFVADSANESLEYDESQEENDAVLAAADSDGDRRASGARRRRVHITDPESEPRPSYGSGRLAAGAAAVAAHRRAARLAMVIADSQMA